MPFLGIAEYCVMLKGVEIANESALTKAFNFVDLIESRNAYDNCRGTEWSESYCRCLVIDCEDDNNLHSSYEPDDVVCLSVARAGSDTLTESLRSAGQPAFHNHDCTLEDVVNAGAQRVVLGTRHPVSRVISGWQRYLGLYSDQLLQLKLDSLNDLIDGLKDVSHPRHADAIGLVYGPVPYNMAFFTPVVQFYLGGHLHVNSSSVKFVCVCTLQSDIAQVAADWELTLVSDEEYDYDKHTSNISSDSAEARAKFLRQDNIEWLERIYQDDLILYNRECSGRCAS